MASQGCMRGSAIMQRRSPNRTTTTTRNTFNDRIARTPSRWKIENQLGLDSLVRAVDVVNGQNGQVAVVTEVTQGDAGTGLELVLVDDLLANIEGDGHGENVAIGKTAVLADAMHTPSVFFLLWFEGHPNRIIQGHTGHSRSGS